MCYFYIALFACSSHELTVYAGIIGHKILV